MVTRDSQSISECMWVGDYEDIENVHDIDEIDLSNFWRRSCNVKHVTGTQISSTKGQEIAMTQETDSGTFPTVDKKTDRKQKQRLKLYQP